jgi:hypothetical protein
MAAGAASIDIAVFVIDIAAFVIAIFVLPVWVLLS